MSKRGRPAKKTLNEKLEEVSVEVEETETLSVSKPRPDPSNRANRRRVSAVGGAGSGGKLGYLGKLDPNFQYRICNDEGTNIEEMKSFGYDVCTGDEVRFKSTSEIQSGSSHSIVVDRKDGTKAILMRQPIEFQNEDRQARKEMIAKGEESMFRNLKTEEGRYGDVEIGGGMSKKIDN